MRLRLSLSTARRKEAKEDYDDGAYYVVCPDYSASLSSAQSGCLATSRREQKRARPPDFQKLPVPSLLLAIALCLTFLPTLVLAQTTSASTSTSSSVSTTASSTSSTSSSSSAVAIPTYSLSSIPTSTSLPSLNASSPIYQLSLPNGPSLQLTFSICSLSSNTSVLPTILLSTSNPPAFNLGSKSIADSSSGGISTSVFGGAGYNRRSSKSDSTWQVVLSEGFGDWTFTATGEAQVSLLLGLGMETDGSLNDVSTTGNVLIQLGASSSEPIHALSPATPLLGDTTKTSALIFSPLLLSSPQTQPSYPNYTLPGNQLTFSTFDTALSTSALNSSLSSNLTLIVVPTSSSPTNDGLDNAWCAIDQARNSTGDIASASNGIVLKSSEPQWMSVGGEEGYRSYWVIGGLISQGNYTAWVRDSTGVLSAPIWFTTKEDTFPCQLVLPSSICPSIGYAAPLSANTTSVTSTSGDVISSTSPIRSLPDDLVDVLTTQLEAFSTSLLSQACGRDIYSHVSTCLDCYTAYRDWLCRIIVPQCASSSSTTTNSTTTTSSNALPSPSTIQRTVGSPRNPSLPSPSYGYTELLPCLSTCNSVDRKCPVWLGMRCPKRSINAARSYAYTGSNEAEGDGSDVGGVPAADTWGDRWCNG